MGKLEGKIALLTGANSGIGLATAKRFVTEGAHVYVTGRRDAELARAASAIARNVTAGDFAYCRKNGARSLPECGSQAWWQPLVATRAEVPVT